jgi:hypothetical protein
MYTPPQVVGVQADIAAFPGSRPLGVTLAEENLIEEKNENAGVKSPGRGRRKPGL